jgi:hypothetical protein
MTPGWTLFLYLVEWIIAPLGVFLLVFSWRDRLSILHMPWADLVAVLVVADVAFAINYEYLRKLADGPLPVVTEYHGDWRHWVGLAVLGLFFCRLLVRSFESRINDIALHHVAAGWLRERPPGFLRRMAALRNGKWWTFTLLWSASVTCVDVFLVAHSLVITFNVSFDLLPDLHLGFFQRALATVVSTFLCCVVLCVLFVISGYCRVYEQPIAQT